ncbi:MAG: lasso peptide biosynthesis protein [Acidobacteriota bacterium]
METDRRGFLGKACFAILATPAVWRASWRLVRHRKRRVDALADALRRAPRWRSGALDHPGHLAAMVDRWLWALPPWGYGRCFKRSLLLLDLWARCGLAPSLHLGARRPPTEDPASAPGRRDFHAWVTTGDGGPWTSSDGHLEIWRG